jgi:hypothetical protein
MTLEDGAIADDETLSADVADNRAWRLNLQFFFRLHVGYDFALNDDGKGADFSLHRRLLADRYTCLRNYLPLNFSFDRRWPVKLQFSMDFCPGPKKGS